MERVVDPTFNLGTELSDIQQSECLLIIVSEDNKEDTFIWYVHSDRNKREQVRHFTEFMSYKSSALYVCEMNELIGILKQEREKDILNYERETNAE